MIKYLRIKFVIFCFLFFKISYSEANVEKIFDYLESFHSMKSNFIQINNNGDILTGNIIILRPGKVRIEYKEIPLLIIGDGKKIATINKKLKNIVFYKLDDAPVKLLLFKNFNSETLDVISLKEGENKIQIKLTEEKFSNKGFVEIIFEKRPFEMKKWTVFRSDNTKTEVLLSNLNFNDNISSANFDIQAEDPRSQIFRN